KPYQQYVIYYNGIPTNKMVHRLVAESYIPNPENKPQVNHKDGDVLNNYVSNLEWVTGSENAKHCANILNRDYYSMFGERMKNLISIERRKMFNAKINQEIANKIRISYIPNVVSLNKLAEKYSISKKTVLLIIQNKIWKNGTVNN